MKLSKLIFIFGISADLLLASCFPPPSALTSTTTSTSQPPEVNLILSPDISDVVAGQTIALSIADSGLEPQFNQDLQFKWSAARGNLSVIDRTFAIYTAPDTPGIDTIVVEVSSASGTTIKSVSFNVIVPLTDTPTPLPRPLVEIFPQVGYGVEFIFPETVPGLISRQFIEAEDCTHSGVYGLQLTYNFTSGGGGGWGVHWASSPTRNFDASSFDVLTFWVKGTLGNETFQIAMRDTNSREFLIESQLLLIVTSDWARVIVPLSAFHSVDISSLEHIIISFNSSHGSDTICVDDIAFGVFTPVTTLLPEVTSTGMIETEAPSPTATSGPTLTLTPTIIAQTPNITETFQAVFDVVNSQYEKSIKANIAYPVPKSMKLDETVIIELFLNPSRPPGELATQISSSFVTSTAIPGELVTGQGGPVEVVTSNIQITDRMKAVLISQEPDAFIIKELHDNAEQPISSINTTKWHWSVTAKERGNKTLVLLISRLIKKDDQEFWVEVESYKANITVNVTMSQWFAALDWRWFLTALPIPLFWWWLNNRQKKGDEQKTSSQPKKKYKS